MPEQSFFWYDYETFGIDPRNDRIAQFAGIRTDLDFNIIDEPIDILCRASDDILPHPEACMVTGISPQDTLQDGLIEAEFIARIHKEFATPNTCVVGFNNLRFDDEFTRYTLYRNFFDPYAREWQNGCSRWDIIDLVRVTRALRPQGIEWPFDDEGRPSNRLELITRANQISHEAAHDALSDVYATIAVAKLIRQQQPRLYDFVYQHKSKQKLGSLLNLYSPQPVLHTSGMYPSELGNTAMVYPLAQHPTNKNGIIVFDLRYSPEALIELPVTDIIERLYTPRSELPEGVERIPLKTIHINKCPVVSPVNTLDDTSAERIQLDRAQHQQHLQQLTAATGLKQKLQQVFSHNPFDEETDPDRSLYSGGFFSPDDRQRMDQLRELSPADLKTRAFNFDDPRVNEMLFRYRARNFPESLGEEERQQWNAYRKKRFSQDSTSGGFSYTEFKASIEQLLAQGDLNEEKQQLLQTLSSWGESVAEGLDLEA